MRWFKNLQVKTKLMFGFASLAAVFAVVGVLTNRNLNKVNDADTALYEEGAVPLADLGLAAKFFQRARGNLRDVILARTPAEVQENTGKVTRLGGELDSVLKNVEPTMGTPERKAAFAAITTARGEWIPVRDKVLEFGQAGDKAKAFETLTAGYQNIKHVEAAIDSLDAVLRRDAKKISDDNSTLTASTTRTLFISVALAAIAALALGWFIAQLIAVPLGRAVEVLETVASGDLTTRATVDTTDEVGRMGTALNRALDSMENTIATITQNAVTLAGSSEELRSVSQSLGASAEETAAQSSVVSAAAEQVSRNIQTVATGAEELSASIREIAKNTADASRVAGTAVKVAETTNATIQQLGESSASIGQVVKVITSIAEQTNLLALNATIEAARAGEAGKGFAVVANEVKELAKETAKATEEIGRKVAAIQGDAQGAVAAIREIGGIIAQINDIQTTIASAVEEQSVTTAEIGRNVTEAAKGGAEIAQNISSVAQAAQSTSGGATETQASAGELSRMAVELQRLVGQFQVSDDAGTISASADNDHDFDHHNGSKPVNRVAAYLTETR